MVLYRKYRPQKLADLFGHEQIKKTLLAQLESGKISHGYLFYGPKGSGKTSTARILAKAVNCQNKSKKFFTEPCNRCLSCTSITEGSNVDLVEIDAASNRGIDEIRQLQETIKLSAISARFKVYIVDEAHMLTMEAFNALLKTLEEPPAHVIFILCTTEVSKLPQTIVSRLSRFNFKRASISDLSDALEKISKEEKINIERDAVGKITEAADGSFRDAVSILDQATAKSGKISAKDVESLTSGASFNDLLKFITLVSNNNLKESVLFVEDLAKSGGDISFFIKQVVLFLEKVLFIKLGVFREAFEDLDAEQVSVLEELATFFGREQLTALMRSMLVAETEAKLYPLPQIPVVLALCKHMAGVGVEGTGDAQEDEEVRKVREVRPSFTSASARAAANKKVSEGKKVREATGDRLRTSQGVDGTRNSTSKSGGSKIRFSHIEKNWGEFLNKIKDVNLHVMALLRSTKIVDFDGSDLVLEVFYRFHKDKLEEPKVIKMLEEAISDVNNSKIRFKFVLAKRQVEVPKAVAKSDVVEIKDEDLAQIAAEIFSK